MRSRSSPLPLSSYDPRYRLLLLQGTVARFSLPAMEYGRAVKLRQQIQSYRSLAKRENAPDWEPLYQAMLRIERLPNGEALLIIEPRAKQFDDVLPTLRTVVESGPIAVPEGGGEPVALEGLLDELDTGPPNEGEDK